MPLIQPPRWTLIPLCLAALQGCGPDRGEPVGFNEADPTPSSTEGQATPGEGGEARDEVEPNNVVADAQTISLGDLIRASLTSSDVDQFKLTIPSDFDGYKITLAATGADGDCFEEVDPYLRVSNGDGTRTLYFVEDVHEHYCPSLSFVPEAGASYVITVGTDWGLYGDYTLSALAGGPGTISGAVLSQARALAQPPTAKKPRGDVVEGDVLLQASPGVSVAHLSQRLQEALGDEALSLRPVMGGRYHLIKGKAPRGMDRAQRRQWTLDRARQVRAIPGVAAAFNNGIFQPLTSPRETSNDPLLGDQWHYGEAPGANVFAAWDTTIGSEEIIVAVIDTGHDADHPDLQGKTAPGGYDFISDADNADDGDGPDPDPADALLNGHGTHVAGTIAADTNNGVGVAGVGWLSRYLPLRVCGNYGCTEADISEAIYYAAGYETVAGPGRSAPRADVINMSLGGHDVCTPPLQDAISAASLRGVIVVVAAGNSSDVTSDYSPAGCAESIAVAALSPSGSLAGFSNYGEGVDIAAPGQQILSTYERGDYAQLQGTSMASPHIAGIVALLKGLDPTFQYDTIHELLTGTANDDFVCTSSRSCGAGLVNAAAAVNAALDAPSDEPRGVIVIKATDIDDATNYATTFTLDGTFTISGLGPGTYYLSASEDNDGDTLPDAETQGGSIFTITADGEDHVGATVPLL